ncbi:hypothetical protein [Xanthomonas phage SB4]|uniref:Tail fiber protein n=1 Tax=Xanthomonas phage SB4 TaxID=3117473 RepID=A0ABZ2GUT3_9CAUD
MPELNTLGPTIKSTYEGQPNTNAYTDADKQKVASLSTVATSGSYTDLRNTPVIITKEDLAKVAGSGEYSDLVNVPDLVELDDSGKIPVEYLNVSGMNFKGAWNASTNTPELLDGEGEVGDFYKVSVAGTFNFGNGEYNFLVGDWVMFAAGVWQRIGVVESVASVNGKVGAVRLTAQDVGAVGSVNGKTGQAVILNAADVSALPATYKPDWADVQGKPTIPPPYVHPKLSYRNTLSSRTANTWYTHSGPMDRIVNITTNYAESSASSIIEMREAGTTGVFSIRGAAIGTGFSNQVIQAIVPSGWQYRFVPGGSRTVFAWIEGDYA